MENILKKAVILHDTNGDPTKDGWQLWLQHELEKASYEVFFPHLPESQKPDLQKYDTFLKNSGWDFANNLVIGHSSGATALIHLLAQDWFPKLRATVLVGTFLNEKKLADVDWYEPGQFDKLFVETFDLEKIKQKADAFYFVHGDDDPYCDYGEAKELCDKLNGTFITIPGGGHISSSTRATGIPELTEVLRQDRVI